MRIPITYDFTRREENICGRFSLGGKKSANKLVTGWGSRSWVGVRMRGRVVMIGTGL